MKTITSHEEDYEILRCDLLLFAIFVIDNDTSTMSYVLKDHLGSMYATVTNGSVDYYSFDAWGRERNPNTFLYDNVPSHSFSRGFCMHEHYRDFGLINMNGRMYDPYTSIFLSPDNYIQAPDNSQSFNRYAYCLNNPLKYTDPDGEFWHIIAGAAIGGISNLAFNWNNCDGWQDYVSYFAIGAAAGGLGAAVGGYVFSAMPVSGFVGGAVSGAVSGATSGFFNGYGNAMMHGASSSETLKYAFQSSTVGGLIGGITGGLSQGFSDLRSGYSFWDGSRIHEFVISNPTLDYNNSEVFVEFNDELLLQDRINDVFDIEIGDYGIIDITTKSSGNYDINSKGMYINIKKGTYAGGYCKYIRHKTSEVHISPYYTNAKNIIDFKAVAGHEIIHAIHNYTFGKGIEKYTEAVAYRYTYALYLFNGQYSTATSIMNTANKIGFWNVENVPFMYYLSALRLLF